MEQAMGVMGKTGFGEIIRLKDLEIARLNAENHRLKLATPVVYGDTKPTMPVGVEQLLSEMSKEARFDNERGGVRKMIFDGINEIRSHYAKE